MGLFKRKVTGTDVSDMLLGILHNVAIQTPPNAPCETGVTPESVREEMIQLQLFTIHLVTTAKLFGTPHLNGVLDPFWGKLAEIGVYDSTCQERFDSYKWTYENLWDSRGQEYCIGVAFAQHLNAESGEPLDFFVSLGANWYTEAVSGLTKLYDSVKITA